MLKRTRIAGSALVGLLIVAAFAAGQQAENLKWPWAKPVWSEDAGLSRLEVELLKSNVDAEPLVVSPYILVSTLQAAAKDKGVHITAEFTFTRRPRTTKKDMLYKGVAIAIYKKWYLGLNVVNHRSETWPVQVDLYLKGKQVHTETFNVTE